MQMKSRDLDKSSFLSYSFLSDSQKARKEQRGEEYSVIAQRPGSRKAFIEQSGGKKLRQYENPESQGLLACLSCNTDDNIDRTVAPEFQGTKDRKSRINTVNKNPQKSQNSKKTEKKFEEKRIQRSPISNNNNNKHGYITPPRSINQLKELNEIAYTSSLNTQEGRDKYRDLMLKRLKIMNLTEEKYEDMIIRDFYSLAIEPDQTDLQKLMVVVNKPDFKINFEISEQEYNKFDELFDITQLKRDKIYSRETERGSRISIQTGKSQNRNFKKIKKEDNFYESRNTHNHTFQGYTNTTTKQANAGQFNIPASQKFKKIVVSPNRTTCDSTNTRPPQYSSRQPQPYRSSLHRPQNDINRAKRSVSPLRTPFRQTYTTPQRQRVQYSNRDGQNRQAYNNIY